MARKKLNIKFIILLCVAALVVAGGVVGLIYGKDLFRPSIASLEKRGDEALASGDYDQAAESYGRAAFRARTDIPLQIKFVDAFEYTVRGDRDQMNKLRQHYSTIFATDPNNVEIVRRMLRAQLNDVRGAPQYRPALRALNETADRLLTLVPNDREALKAKIVAVLEPYQRNLEVSAEEVSNARESAEKLYEQDPSDGEIVLMSVRFHLEEAKDAAARGDATATAEAMQKAKTFIDQAMVKTPENAEAFFAAFNVYRALGSLSVNQTQDQRRAFLEQSNKFLQRADQLAKPEDFPTDDERFLNIRAFAIRMIELRDNKEAEARYRQLVQEMPNNRWPRLLLSQFLAKIPNRRADAAEVLEAQWQPTKPLHGMESMQQEGLKIQEQLRLCAIWLGSLENISNSTEREAVLSKVEAQYARLASIPSPGGSLVPWLSRIQGGIALERGRVSEAIEHFDSALKLLPADAAGQSESEIRNEVLMEYANAHLRIGQTGKARPALLELITRDPINMIARVKLVQVLQSERKFDESIKQTEELAKFLGKDHPAVQQLDIANYAGRQDALREKYVQYPETTQQQMAIKLDVAGRLGDLNEQERLARTMLKLDPKNAQLAMALSQMLLRQDKRDEAMLVIDAASKESPNNEQLAAFRKSLAAETPEERRQLLDQRIDDIQDPYQRELTRAEVQRLQGKVDEAIASLRKAETIDPKNYRAIEAQFQLLLAQRKVAEADTALQKLASLKTDEADLETKRVLLMVARAQESTSPTDRTQLVNDALQKASTVSRKYPELAQPALVYANLLQDTGSFPEALEQYQLVLDKQPNNVEATRGVVNCMIALKRYDEARNILQAARNYAPNDEGFRQLELSLELDHGDPVRVIDTLTSMRDKNIDSPQAWAQLGYALERVSASKAQKNDQTGAQTFNDRAAALWAQAMEKFPADLRFASAYADAQRRAGKATESEAAIEKLAASAAWVDKPEVIELLALQYQRSGKPQQAEQVLRDFLARTKPMPTSTLLKLALLYIDQQQLKAALEVLDLKKEDPDVRRTRIELLIMANDLASARNAVEEALATKTTPELNLLAAFIESRDGNWEKADGFLASVLKERPNDPAALFYRAQVRLNTVPSNVDGARDDLQKVLVSNPGNIEARLAMADIMIRRNQSDQAVRQLEDAWKYNPSSKPVLIKLVEAYLAGTQPRRFDAQKAIDLAKQNVPQFASDADVLLLEANVQLAMNQNAKTIALAKQALAVAPDNQVLRQRYFELMVRAGANRDVIKESEPILQQDRGAWWLYRLRGMAYRRLDQKTEALAEFDAAFNLVAAAQNEQAIGLMARTIAQEIGVSEAIKRVEPLAKTDINAKLLLALLYQNANDPQRSLAELERVQTDKDRLRPDQLRSLLQNLGVVYLQVTPPQPAKAKAAYEELLTLMPKDMLLLNNLAYVNTIPESGGTMQKALEYSTKAYEISQTISSLDPSVPYVLDTHGYILVQSKKLLEGLDLLRRAAEQAKFPEVYLHLAEAYMMDNQIDLAQRSLDEAKSIIESLESKKLPIDPTIRSRYERVSADIAKMAKSSTGAGQ